jgi:adenylate cyclase
MPEKPWTRYFHQTTLRTNILAIFLTLLSSTALLIVGFTYWRGFQSIYKFSTEVIEEVSNVIIGRVKEITGRMEQLAENTISLLPNINSFSFDNEAIISYMLSVVQTERYLYGIYFGTPQGSLLEAVNLAAAYQTHFIFDATKPLPAGSAYVLRFLDRGKTPIEDVWTYKTHNLKTIATESLRNPVSDPRTRPWYKGAVAQKKLFWTPVYNYDPLGEPGITVSKAIFTPTGELIAVVGVDISLNLFSHFLTDQKIGETGRAFILNTSGEVIIPTEGKNSSIYGTLPEGSVHLAFNEYQRHHKTDFLLTYDDVEYLASVHEFPVTGSKDLHWMVLIIAPMEEFLSDLIVTQYEVLAISAVIFIIASTLMAYFAKRISVPIVTLAHETDKIRHLEFANPQRINSHIFEIILMDDAVDALRKSTQSFSRYIPKEIVQQLTEKGAELKLGGEKKEVTIFFSDIDGFTSMAESRPVEEMMALLKEYFDLLSKIILKNKGNIDKYIGDSIMALWGAPLEIPHSEIEACRTALECQQALQTLNERYQREGKPLFLTRIGIDAGEVVVGNIGTDERMNYTAIGNSVNRAARLQVANKNYRTSILISDQVAQKLTPDFLVRPLDTVELKGQQEKTKLYELVALGGTPEQKTLCAQFTAAYETLERGDQEAARRLFQELLASFPNDYPTQLYTESVSKVGFGPQQKLPRLNDRA